MDNYIYDTYLVPVTEKHGADFSYIAVVYAELNDLYKMTKKLIREIDNGEFDRIIDTKGYKALHTSECEYVGSILPISEKQKIIDSVQWKPYEISKYIDSTLSISDKDDTIKENNSALEENDMEDIYNYMNWGDYNKRISELAGMVIQETWDFPNSSNYQILKNYLNYTYQYLLKTDKLIKTDSYCLFNTGLFTDFYEPIYIYGEPSDDTKNKWVFKGFMTEYDLGYKGISEYPERADYFYDTSLLVFDWHCKININYKHILSDENNKNRLPKNVLESDRPLDLLKGSIDTAIKRVMANYKLAVPQFFQSKIQLLIPLCFGKTDKPDLALTLTKMGNFYQGHTCLTLDMAYNNARLIAKPESNWLVP